MNLPGNYILNLARMGLGGEPVRPLLFSWYATHRCSLKCVYCCDGKGEPFKNDVCRELSPSEVGEMMAILRKAGNILDVTGGEPLERPDLEAILASAKKLGFRTILNTKGLGIGDRPNILKHCDVIALSVDSLSPAALGKITGGGEDVGHGILSALEFLLSQRQNFRYDLTLVSVIMADTIIDVREALDFAEKEKLSFAVSPRIDGIHVNKELKNNPEYQGFIRECIKRKSQGARVLGVREYLDGLRDFSPYRCYPGLMPTIRPDGALYHPCIESGVAPVNLLIEKNYWRTLRKVAGKNHFFPICDASCQIMCHMGLSKLQSHPLGALRELFTWR